MSSACKVFYVKNTKQKSNKIHPLFDENFDIPISTDSKVTLDDFRLKITVFRYTFSGSNDIIGLVLLGSGTSSLHEAAHWKEVTHNPHKTVMKWHKLRIGWVKFNYTCILRHFIVFVISNKYEWYTFLSHICKTWICMSL